MSPIFGLDQGFDHYLNQQFVTTEGPPYPTADRITDAAIAAVSAPWDGPLFLFVNYMDAHQPWICLLYTSPSPRDS